MISDNCSQKNWSMWNPMWTHQEKHSLGPVFFKSLFPDIISVICKPTVRFGPIPCICKQRMNQPIKPPNWTEICASWQLQLTTAVSAVQDLAHAVVSACGEQGDLSWDLSCFCVESSQFEECSFSATLRKSDKQMHDPINQLFDLLAVCELVKLICSLYRWLTWESFMS